MHDIVMWEDAGLLGITSGGCVLNCALRGPETQRFWNVHVHSHGVD